MPCFSTLSDISGGVDAAFLAVPAAGGPDLVDEAAAKGIKAIYLNASGYADGNMPEGRARQDRIVATAAAHSMAICGPNNTGIINFHDRVAMWTGSMPEVRQGTVAVITQSGSASMVISESLRGMGTAYVITCGNEAVANVADYLDYVVRDDRVSMVLLFLETIRNPDKFAAAAIEAARRGTRILAIKIGRSKIGQAGVSAHTGSVAGDDAVYEAFFRKYGIVRADDLDELIEMAVLFGDSPQPPRTPHVVPITLSGGEAALAADLGTAMGVSLPPLAPHVLARVREALPPFSSPRNPLDAFGLGFNAERFAQLVNGLLLDQATGVIAPIVDAPASGGIDAQYTCEIARVLLRLAPVVDKKFVLINSSASSGIYQPAQELVEGSGITFLTGMREGLAAVAAWTRYTGPHVGPAEPDFPEVHRLSSLFAGAQAAPEVERFAALAGAGLPMVPTLAVSTAVEAVIAGSKLGLPLVLKGTARGLGHKSDLGLVRVGLHTTDEVATAFDEISAALAVRPGLVDAQVLAQPMAGKGIELIAGIRNDPSFGTVVVVGVGGVLVELLKDVSIRLGAVDRDGALEMLRETAAATLLAGVRGAGPYDLAAAADAIARLSLLGVATRGLLKSIEINPLIVLERGSGAVGVDALIE